MLRFEKGAFKSLEVVWCFCLVWTKRHVSLWVLSFRSYFWSSFNV